MTSEAEADLKRLADGAAIFRLIFAAAYDGYKAIEVTINHSLADSDEFYYNLELHNSKHMR